MEFQKRFIILDKPFMKQQAFKDLLKLPNAQAAHKIKLDDLLGVTKVLIKNELAAHGYSELELISFRLECQVSQSETDEPGEIYLAEWNNLPQKNAVESTDSVLSVLPASEENQDIVSSEFTAKLIERLDEVIMEFSPLSFLEGHKLTTSTTFNFSSGITRMDVLECSNDCIVDGRRFKKNLTT